MNKLLLFLLLPTLVFSQIDVSYTLTDGYFKTNNFGEGMVDLRYSHPLVKKSLYVTPSVAFVTDGMNYQTFPRLGVTKLISTKKKNWNRLTLGLQVYDLDIPGKQQGWERTFILSDESWKLRPFLKFHTPIFRLYKNTNCYCKKEENKLLMELIIDASYQTLGVGFGVRKRI